MCYIEVSLDYGVDDNARFLSLKNAEKEKKTKEEERK